MNTSGVFTAKKSTQHATIGADIKTIKLRMKGGQPAMPRGANWFVAVRNLLEFF